MPPTVDDRLRDILEAIAEIEEMLADASLEQFDKDKIRRMATERTLRSYVKPRGDFPMKSNEAPQILTGVR